MLQKIIKVGNSAAVTLNPKLLMQMGFDFGDKIQTEYIPEAKKIVISQPKKPGEINDRQLLTRIRSLEKKYSELYRKLAKFG